MAVGMCLYAVAYVYNFQVVILLDPMPFPSLADAAWVGHYPFIYAGVLLLLRRRVLRFHASMWVDGLLAGLCVTAFAAAFVLPVVLQSTGGSFAVVTTNLAYPVSDVLLMALLLAVFALFGWQPDRTWWLLAAGLVAFLSADTAYLFAVSSGTYLPAGPIDLLWMVGVVLPALAGWLPMRSTVRVQLDGWQVLLVPCLFSGLCLGLLTYAGMRSVPAAAVLLAAAAVLVALVRTGLTFREMRALGDARLQARTDELTGMPNRRSFLEQTAAALERRTPSGRLVLLLIDLDRFKEINDSFGHPMGDTLLRMVSTRLAAELRATDVVARLGGDEFGVVLVDADQAYAVEIAHRLRAALRRPFDLQGLAVTVDASIGMALCPQHGNTSDVLLQRADIALYQAKAADSGYEVYRVDGDSHTRQRLETLQQLRTGLTEDQLVVHYQPKLELGTGRVVGVEALVRWQHPVRGLVYPDGFVPLAEQAGLMRLLTLAVLEKAVRQVAEWRRAGLVLRVAVNLSVSDLRDTALPAQVQLLLDALQVPADALELEITENVLMSDPDRALQVLSGLRALGVRLCVDDYGTGYSSLAYLRALPVHELKLDRTFVTHMDTDVRSGAIVLSTVALAHSLDMVMVAEGVENPTSLQQLTDAGCDLAQGYHIARPQPAETLTPWLLAHPSRHAAGLPAAGRCAAAAQPVDLQQPGDRP